tara:strand:+ start:303 stop:644 length:342 start_codon:yes stop_codon:yes gene_type:complete
MSYDPKMIKSKEVLVDRDIGQAEITVTLIGRNPKQKATVIGKKELVQIGLEGGAEVLEVLSGGGSLHNIYGEATRTWVVKIPSTDPEHSTAAVLKRRAKAKKKEAEDSEKQGE